MNQDTIPLVPQESLQYGRAFDRFIRHILLADKRYGPVFLSKCDLSDEYYRLGLCIQDCPQLALSFPAKFHNDPLVAIPIVLPMGWKNSGPAFCAATETIADLANAKVATNQSRKPHPLNQICHGVLVFIYFYVELLCNIGGTNLTYVES